MDKERLMDLLRNPKKFQKKKNDSKSTSVQQTTQEEKAARKASSDRMAVIAAGGVAALALLSLLFVFSASKRAENVTAALDPAILKGLVADRTFHPGGGVRYVQVGQGHERNVSVTGAGAGSVIPVISRYNFRALTPQNYAIIGTAPFALSINVDSNAEDPDLLRYLFNDQNVTDAFLARPDVAPYLADPAALAKLAADKTAVDAFLADATVQRVLASAELTKALAGSRLFSSMLISKAVKYYRDRPAQAAKLINSSPALAALKKNPNVRQAVAENRYLKNISATLLK